MKSLKKIILSSILMILMVMFVSVFTHVNADSVETITNSNGVSITMENYEKLLSLGFLDQEIDILTNEEYDEFSQMEIIHSNVDSYYIETEHFVEDDVVVDSIDTEIAEEDLEQAIEESISLDEAYQNATTYRTTEYKKMTVTGTYFRNADTMGEFFVKVNLEWRKEPRRRLEDVIGIAFSDNIQMKSEYIDGAQYAQFSSKFMYTERYFHIYGSNYEGPTYTNKVEYVNGLNVDRYNYDIDEGIMVSYNLPADSYSDLSSSVYPLVYSYDYSDFVITLSASFIPKQAGINAATFAGVYEHQIGLGSIDWGNVSISPMPPYFSYNTSIWVNDPNYDDPIAGQIFFENLLSLPDVRIVLDQSDKPILGSEVTLNDGVSNGLTIKQGFTRIAYLSSGSPSTSRLDYNWTSSNNSVATVSQYGTIIAKSPGTTNIKAALKSNPLEYDVITITVLPTSESDETEYLTLTTDYRVTESLNGTEVTVLNQEKGLTTIHKGYTRALCFTTLGQSYTLQDFNWSSENTSIATVSNYGYVRGVSAGEVKITGVCKYNSNIKAEITIIIIG